MFNIGQKVMVRQYESLPEEVKIRSLAKYAGKRGEVVDVVYSQAKGCYHYKVLFDDCDTPSKTDFPEGSLFLLVKIPQVEYKYEFEILENLVIAKLYEVTETSKEEIAKGHGHIIHDGVVGIAKAASYALKKIYFSLNGEELRNV